MPAIELRGVGKRFGDAWAVRDLDLTIETGETFVLVGASGCGKTTTLRMINRLEAPSTGTVKVLGRDTAQVDGPQLRRSIGYVIQADGLFAHLDVRANVGVVPRLLGWDQGKTRARVDELLERVGLPPSQFASRFPAELSGGQRQRVGIARALAADPPIVLLDEPFGALDPVTRERMQEEFVALARELDKTYVFVTHDMREAVRLGDRIAVMDAGRLIRCATPTQLLRDPGSETAAALLGAQRIQLRLMTTRLADLPTSSEAPPNADTAVELSDQDTVWDALTACERERASCVVVQGRWVSREILVSIVLPSKTRA